MKLHVRIALCAAVFLAGKAQAVEVLGAIAASAQAVSDATVEITDLVNKVNSSMGAIEQRVLSLSSSFKAIAGTKQPQVVIKTTFNAIDSALGMQEIVMPLVKELMDVVAVISDKLLPAIGRLPGAPAEIAQASQHMNTVVGVVNRVKNELATWGPRIRQLTASIGGHVLAITQQVENTVTDLQKVF